MAAEIRYRQNAAIRSIMRRYYAMWLAYSLAGGFIFGVYPLFLRSRGLNQFQINSVLAVYFVVIFATDVPTGAFADAIGRRKSFLLGCALRVAGFLMYFFVHSYPLFIVAELIDGVGTTFCSGAIDAWGVDALDQAGFGELKDHLFSRISQFMNFGFMAAALAGAYAANVNIAWPWVLGAAGFVVSGTLAGYMMREGGRRAAPIDLAAIPRLVVERAAKGLRRGFGDRTVLLLSTANAILFAAWVPYWLQWPQYFNDGYGVGIWIVGWLYCVLTVARMAGAEVIARLTAEQTARGARLAGLVVAASALLFVAGTAASRPNMVLVVLFTMNLCIGAMQPLGLTWFNEQIGAGERATLLSFNSTFSTLGGSLGLLVSGYLADLFGIPVAWQVSALVLICAAPCYWVSRSSVGRAAEAAGAAK